MAIRLNEDTNQVELELVSQPGEKIILREPTTRDILLSRSWFAANPELQTQELLNLKIIQLITLKFGDRNPLPNFDQWLDVIHLDNFIKDMGVLAKALELFRLSDRLNSQKPNPDPDTEPGT